MACGLWLVACGVTSRVSRGSAPVATPDRRGQEGFGPVKHSLEGEPVRSDDGLSFASRSRSEGADDLGERFVQGPLIQATDQAPVEAVLH
jgi:hypothetical protein